MTMADQRTYSRAELEEVAGMCAGAAAGVFLRKHPKDVMPTEEISEVMDAVLADFSKRRGEYVSPLAGGGLFSPTTPLLAGEPDGEYPRTAPMPQVRKPGTGMI
jgi:hypothetical protein